MKNLLYLFISLVSISTSTGQNETPTISGIVIDDQTGLGIGDLIVRLEHGSWYEAFTTDDGKYHFKGDFKVGHTYSFDVVDPLKRYAPQKATNLRTLEGGTLETIKLLKPEETLTFIIHDSSNKGAMLDDVVIRSNVVRSKKIVVDGVYSIGLGKIKKSKTFFTFEKEGYEPVNLDNIGKEERIIYIPLLKKQKASSNKPKFKLEKPKPRTVKKTTFLATPENAKEYFWTINGTEKISTEKPLLEKKFKQKGIYHIELSIKNNGKISTFEEEVKVKGSLIPYYVSSGLLLTAIMTDQISDGLYKNYQDNPENNTPYVNANNWHHIAVVSLYASIGTPIIWNIIEHLNRRKAINSKRVTTSTSNDQTGFITPHPTAFGLVYHF